MHGVLSMKVYVQREYEQRRKVAISELDAHLIPVAISNANVRRVPHSSFFCLLCRILHKLPSVMSSVTYKCTEDLSITELNVVCEQ